MTIKVEKILMGCAPSLFDKTCEVLTQVQWKKYFCNDELVQRVLEIRACKDEEKQRKLKQRMPVVLYQGMAVGEVKNENTVRNGLVFIDVDIPESEAFDRQSFYTLYIYPALDALGVLHVSESLRYGLHLVVRPLPGEEDEACRKRVLTALGLEKWMDGCVKNAARKAYVGGRVFYSDLHHLLPADDAEAAPLLAKVSEQLKLQQASESLLEPFVGSTADTKNYPFIPLNLRPDTYQGVPYEKIVEQLISNLYGGLADVGGRHAQSMRLAYLLAQITDFDVEWVLSLLPKYNPPMPEQEVRKIAEAGCAQRRMPRLDRALLTAIADCRRMLLGETADEERTVAQMPTVNIPLFKEFLRCCPKGFESAVFWTLMPMLATLCSRCTMRYLNGVDEPIVFLVCLMGRQASGKSSIRRIEEEVMRYVRQEDREAQRKIDQWRELCAMLSSSKDRPAEPKVYQRMVGIVASVSAWAKMMQRAEEEGRALYSSTEELDEMLKQKAAFNEKSTWMRKGNDGGLFSQDYLMKDTFSGKVSVRHNFLLAGTPDRAMKYFKEHVHDGLAGRFVYPQLPVPTSAAIPTFTPFNARQREVIDQVIQRLDLETGEICLPRTHKMLREWLETKWKEAVEAGDEALEVFRVRAANIACRAAAILYLCNERRETPTVVSLARWAADFVLTRQLDLFASGFKTEAEQTGKHTVQSLLTQLPQEFTRDELVRLRVQRGESTDVRMILIRWRRALLIEDVRPGIYRKV